MQDGVEAAPLPWPREGILKTRDFNTRTPTPPEKPKAQPDSRLGFEVNW
jgi:hypothetical protein